MFTIPSFPTKQNSSLDDALEDAILELQSHNADSDEYRNIVNQITALNEVRNSTKRAPLSKDTLALVAGHLLGVWIIVSHEHVNVITSKAFSMIGKTRV
jgi:hypothetical protein